MRFWQCLVRGRIDWRAFIILLRLLVGALVLIWLVLYYAAKLCVNLCYSTRCDLGQVWIYSQTSGLFLHLLHGLDIHISYLLLNQRLFILLLLQLLLLVSCLLSLMGLMACIRHEKLGLLAFVLLARLVAVLMRTKVLLLAPTPAALTRLGHHSYWHAGIAAVLLV